MTASRRVAPPRPLLALAAHSLVPVTLGLVIYLTCRRGSLVLHEWFAFWPQTWILVRAPSWVHEQLPDALWTYGVVSGLMIGSRRAPRTVAAAGAVTLALGTEVAQGIGVLPGTFDVWDLAAMTVASVCAVRVHARRRSMVSPRLFLRSVPAVVIVAVFAFGLLGTSKPKGSRRASTRAVPKMTVDAGITPVPPPAPTGSAGTELLTTNDELITVQIPKYPGGDCRPAAVRGQHAVTMVKCRRRAESEFLFMLAKDYTVRVGEERSAKHLATQVFRTNYTKLFSDLNYISEEPGTWQGKPTFEVEFDARHQKRGAIHKRERVATGPGGHVLITSAEGDPAMMKRFASDVGAWFRNTRFASLR